MAQKSWFQIFGFILALFLTMTQIPNNGLRLDPLHSSNLKCDAYRINLAGSELIPEELST